MTPCSIISLSLFPNFKMQKRFPLHSSIGKTRRTRDASLQIQKLFPISKTSQELRLLSRSLSVSVFLIVVIVVIVVIPFTPPTCSNAYFLAFGWSSTNRCVGGLYLVIWGLCDVCAGWNFKDICSLKLWILAIWHNHTALARPVWLIAWRTTRTCGGLWSWPSQWIQLCIDFIQLNVNNEKTEVSPLKFIPY